MPTRHAPQRIRRFPGRAAAADPTWSFSADARPLLVSAETLPAATDNPLAGVRPVRPFCQEWGEEGGGRGRTAGERSSGAQHSGGRGACAPRPPRVGTAGPDRLAAPLFGCGAARLLRRSAAREAGDPLASPPAGSCGLSSSAAQRSAAQQPAVQPSAARPSVSAAAVDEIERLVVVGGVVVLVLLLAGHDASRTAVGEPGVMTVNSW